MINDQTLDLVFNFLKTYSQYFQKNFCANIDESLFSECEERKISEVKFKITKKKRTPKYSIGDMCAIPLRRGGYAFSRIISLKAPMWYLSEIFAYYSEDKSYRKEIEESGYLFPPIFITPSDYKRWDSPIIHQYPNYKSSFYAHQFYYYGLPNNYRKVKIGEQEGIHITNEEAKEYPKMIFEDQISKIEEALAERGLIFN